MTDEQLKRICAQLKLPKVMWDTKDFRAYLLRLIEAARGMK